jgi:hypothetical protein
MESFTRALHRNLFMAMAFALLACGAKKHESQCDCPTTLEQYCGVHDCPESPDDALDRLEQRPAVKMERGAVAIVGLAGPYASRSPLLRCRHLICGLDCWSGTPALAADRSATPRQNPGTTGYSAGSEFLSAQR